MVYFVVFPSLYSLTGAPNLTETLRESGKSRADLWQFAGNIALELAVNLTNPNCEIATEDPHTPILERQIILQEGYPSSILQV